LVSKSCNTRCITVARNDIPKYYFLLTSTMYKRLNELNFIVGLFFTIVSVILFLDSLLSKVSSGKLTLYTGLVFLTFGLLMMAIKTKKD
jgi:hypothetical protein